MQRFDIDPVRSTIVVEARSSVGPIVWEAADPRGEFTLALDEGRVEPGTAPAGWLELPLDSLSSGNRVYDAELQRRVDADRHPVARLEVVRVSTGRAAGSFHVGARLEFHGVSREIAGDVEVERLDDGRVVVTGEQMVDIRDFGLPAPTMLMLKVYPDVRVHLVVAGEPSR